MNSRELVRKAIDHEQTPVLPYCFDVTGECAEKVAGETGEEDVYRFLDNDVLCISPPWWGWHELEADWYSPTRPSSPSRVTGRGGYGEFFERLEQSRAETDKYILALVYGSHFEKANFARGIENFLADLAGHPEFAQGLLDRIIEKNMVMLENFLARPEIDGVLLGSDWGTQLDLIMSPDTWRQMIRAGEQREYDLLHSYGKDVWVHSCGNVEKIIPDLVEMGVQVLNPVQPEAMDLDVLKRDYGSKLAFWGGLSTQQTLPFGSPDEVKQEARKVRELMGRGGGYIFAPAQSLQGDVPVENILALLEVAREET